MVEYEGYAQTVAFVCPDYIMEDVMAFREKLTPDLGGSPEQTDFITWVIGREAADP